MSRGKYIDRDALEDFAMSCVGGVVNIEQIHNFPAADVAPVPKWISVKDRLPEEYTRVIEYMAWKAMTAIEYQNGKWYSIGHLEPLPDAAVTYWMPLPEPPEEN